MKKILLLLLFLVTSLTYAQNNGITYQAVIYKPNGDTTPGFNNTNAPLALQQICIQFSIIDNTDQTEYRENITTTTDKFGMVNVLIGAGNQVGGYAGGFTNINWDTTLKRLIVNLDISGNCNNFEEISNQLFSVVPFAYNSFNATNATNVTGVVPIANGGTNAVTVQQAKINFGLDLVDNTSDLNKPISLATQTALNAKENSNNKSTDVTLSDLSNTKFPTELAVKTFVTNQITAVNTSGNTSIIALQADVDANEIAANVAIALKEDAINKSTNVTLSDVTNTKFPTELAVKTFVNGQISTANTNTTAAIAAVQADVDQNELDSDAADATLQTSINILTSTVSQNVTNTNTAIAAVQADVDANEIAANNAIALKEDAVNKSTDVTLSDLSNTKFPTELAVKTFVNGQIVNGIAANVSGVVAVVNGGTGTTNIAGIQSLLGLRSDNVAIGNEAGLTNQSTNSIAIGGGSGRTNQGAGAIGIGYVSGDVDQGLSSIAIGPNAAQANQSNQAIAIGYAAGQNNQGQDAIAIGTFSGQSNQAANSIAINASGTNSPLNPINAGFYVDPIRGASETNSLFYNTTTKEITYGTLGGNFVDLTTNQSIAGTKTFTNDLIVNNINIGRGSGNLDSNIGIGTDALANNTTGVYNIAYGNEALKYNTSGSDNVAIGGSALNGNDNGTLNTAIGNNSGVSTGGLTNTTAIGYDAKVATSNTIQLGNTSITNVKTSGSYTGSGFKTPNGTASQFLKADGSVDSNSYLSSTADLTAATGLPLTTGVIGILPVINGGTGSATQNFVDLTTDQTIAGAKSFSSNATFNGQTIGKGNASGDQNLAIGAGAMNGVSTGTRNTAVGFFAMLSYVGSSFDNNTSLGYSNLVSLTTGSGNTSVGAEAMLSNAIGTHNTSIGNQSLINVTGHENIGIGKSSGATISTGSQNTIIGTNADALVNNLNNATAIGYEAKVASSNTIQLGNAAVSNVKTSGTITAGAITLPNTDGTSGQVLTTNGSGIVAWNTPSTTATAYSGTLPVANGGTGTTTLTGLVKGNGTGAMTAAVAGTDYLQAVAPGNSGNVLSSNGTTWVSNKSGSNSIICKMADAPTTILTIGDYEFRYNSTANGGFIEVRSSSSSDNMMVFCQKNTGSWDLNGATGTQNYRNNTSVFSSWSPVMRLWNSGSSGWNDRVTLSTYDSFEATIFSMGNGSTIPNPLKSYKIFAAIDGYNQVFIKAEYTIR
jgi:hypothetical protein